MQREKGKKPTVVFHKRNREEEERCVKAGLDRIGPNTPIGKIKQRLARVAREGASTNTGDNVDDTTPVNADELLHDALIPVKQIYATKGIVAARKHLDALPSRKNFKGCKGKLAYWAAYIDIEREDKEWERVAELFERARVSIPVGEDLNVLQTMFERFEKETTDLYEEERQKLDQRYKMIFFYTLILFIVEVILILPIIYIVYSRPCRILKIWCPSWPAGNAVTTRRNP